MFEERVVKVHGNNQHSKDYIKWINAVRKYKEETK
jgi:hypothetical protein